MTPSDLDLSQPAPTPRTLDEAQQLIQALWQQLAALQQRLKELEEQEENHHRDTENTEGIEVCNGVRCSDSHT